MFHKMSLGCKIVTLPKLQPDLYFNTIEKYKTNVLFVAPPLECLINGAAPLSNSDVERFMDKVKRDIDFRQGYGLTETSPTVTITPRNWMKKNYAVTGPPIPNTELRI
ncbi:AMP dependent coa ligase, partial [Operophtera brumata]